MPHHGQQGSLPKGWQRFNQRRGAVRLQLVVSVVFVACLPLASILAWYLYTQASSSAAERQVIAAKPGGFERPSQSETASARPTPSPTTVPARAPSAPPALPSPFSGASSVPAPPATAAMANAAPPPSASTSSSATAHGTPLSDKPENDTAAPADNVTEIGVAYGTEKRHWLNWAVEEFARTEEGKTIRVKLIPMGSLESAHAIVDGDERIHVWAPASKLYRETFLREWEAKHRDNLEYRDSPIAKGEALALTPMVIVMWKNRYDAFLTKAPEVSMRMIYYAMTTRTGWRIIADRPEWGHFKFGHTHPNQSNSGLVTLIALAYDFNEKTSGLTVGNIMSPEFQSYLIQFERGVSGLSNSTGNLMREMIFKGPQSFDALMVYESVAIDFLKKAEGRWGKLHVAYPKYNLWNDNPYYILNTPWTTLKTQRAADIFLQFLMSEPIQLRALDHGFRPGNPSVPVRGPDSPFVRYADCGLSIEIPAVCEPPSPEVIENLQQSWIRNAVPR